MANLIPAGESYILVGWSGQFLPDRRGLEFGVRDGLFSEPPDDEAAVAELKRLRRMGARYVVFPWPAFWWLDYYLGLRQHLESAAKRLCSNGRLILFGFGD